MCPRNGPRLALKLGPLVASIVRPENGDLQEIRAMSYKAESFEGVQFVRIHGHRVLATPTADPDVDTAPHADSPVSCLDRRLALSLEGVAGPAGCGRHSSVRAMVHLRADGRRPRRGSNAQRG